MQPKQEQLEAQMSRMSSALDDYLEEMYGEHYHVHPNRLKRGRGSNPSFDGLFATSVAFTLGYGTKHGRGYVVNVEIRTLDKVSQYDRAQILAQAFGFVSDNLGRFIPGRDLDVVQDGNTMKIVGDFSLGEL